MRDNIEWIVNQNTMIFIQENVFEYIANKLVKICVEASMC